jgi:hypothetical protein
MSAEKKTGAGLQPLYEIVGYLDRRAPFPIGSLLLGAVGGVYLFNPTAGVLELIPDNLPVVGNLDEASAAFILFWCGGNLVRWWRIRRAQRKALAEHKEEP